MSAIETTSAPVAEPAASTGPTSEEGKAVSSRNAVKHNLCSKKLTGSDLEEFNAVRTKLDEEWEPSTETERMLLEQMALSQWRMARALDLELAVFDLEAFDATALALVLRYRTAAERAFYKALTELQRLRASIREDGRRQQDDEEAAVQREIERLIMAPIARTPQFVSQNPVGARPARPDNGLPQEAGSVSDRPAPHFVSQNHPPDPQPPSVEG
ncbi:MAG: hypothetical protein WB676_27475 [Bryobacteraceae bacterium]